MATPQRFADGAYFATRYADVHAIAYDANTYRAAISRNAVKAGLDFLVETKQIDKARALLRRVGLESFVHVCPTQLSHGMRQRAALARTFCLDSPILLMDEPFGALDAQTKLQLEDLLLEHWSAERRTVRRVCSNDPACAQHPAQCSSISPSNAAP